MIEKFFKLRENNTTVGVEVFAGITTFMTMAYILVVNPSILSDAGMDRGAVFVATALSAGISTLFMAFFANYPFALAPGLGLNAYFAYTVATEYGWQLALLAVFIEGIIFIIFSAFNVREAIFNAIPKGLKNSIVVALGFFIAFIGLVNAGIIVQNPATSVALGDVTEIGPALALIGIAITVVFVIKNVKGALFWGIMIVWGLGISLQLMGIYVVDELNPSLLPQGIISVVPPSLESINLFTAISEIDFSVISLIDILIVVSAFLFVDMFDTIGTLIGVSEKADLLDKDDKLPKLKQALLADAFGTTIGAMLGTSTVSTYVESAAGVTEGGRTGLTAVVTALLFFTALLFSPIFVAIPSFATSPALFMVGLFMTESVVKINFKDHTEGLPAFVTIIMMPLTYSIADGLTFGFLSYVVVKFASGKGKEINPMMYIIAILFMLKIIL